MTDRKFEIVNSINSNTIVDEQMIDEHYVPFFINRALSYFPDTLFYANEMNMYSDIDNDMQYRYLLNSIRPRKRFSKWHKRQLDDDIEILQQYYQCNFQRAIEAKQLLTAEEIEQIKTIMKED